VTEDSTVTVTLCVCSSCHMKGSRKVIMGFNEWLTEHGLEDKVELKVCFCMERCGEGVNWQIDDELFTSSSVDEAIKTFRQRIIEPAENGI